MRSRFTAELWEHSGDAPWHFVTLPPELSDEIADRQAPKSGFGAVRVTVTVGETIWRTSLFPDGKAGAYLLPIKREVRSNEALSAGDRVTVTVELQDA